MKENYESKEAIGLWQMVLEYLKDICYMVAFVVLLFTFCIRFVIVSGDSMFNTRWMVTILS